MRDWRRADNPTSKRAVRQLGQHSKPESLVPQAGQFWGRHMGKNVGSNSGKSDPVKGVNAPRRKSKKTKAPDRPLPIIEQRKRFKPKG